MKSKALTLEKIGKRQIVQIGIAIVLVLTTIMFALCVTASGQDKKTYTVDKIDPNLELPDPAGMTRQEYQDKKRDVNNAVTRLEQTTLKTLTGDNDFGPNRDELTRYFNSYLLPKMTHYDDTNVELGKMRDRLFQDFLIRKTATQPRDYVLDSVLFPYAKKICEGDYHPAARLNAMYIIANLNRTEASGRSTPPRPMSQALDYMVQTADSTDAPAYLKVAALQGIERHVSLDGQLDQPRIDAGLQISLAARMMKILDQPYTGKKSEDDLNYFQQRIATRVLGWLRQPGTDNAIAKKLKSMIADEKLRMWLRNDAVEAFGRLKFTAGNETEVKDGINASLSFVSTTARSQSAMIGKDLTVLRENAIAYKGQDLTKSGVKKDKKKTVKKAEAGVGGEFERESKGSEDEAGGPKVELPMFRLNQFRRQFKTVADTAATAIYGNDMKVKGGLAQYLSEADAKKFQELAGKIRLLMRDIDVAIMGEKFDQRNRTEQDDLKTNKALTVLLREALSNSADQIDKVATKTKPIEKPATKADKKKTGTKKAEAPPFGDG